MLSIEPLLEHVVPFALVVARIAGLFALTPVLSIQVVPMRFRALIAIMFAAAVYPALQGDWQVAPQLDLVVLLPLLACELLIGLSMGFLVMLPILSLNMAGYIMGYQMGLSLAHVYNPELGETDMVGQFLMYMALAIFVAIGGLEAMFIAMMNTFEHVPLGGFALAQTPLNPILGIFTASLELALRIAAPVLCIQLLLMIAMGFIMKTMPQINILSVGFALKIVFGLAMLVLALVSIQYAAADEIKDVLHMILHWSTDP